MSRTNPARIKDALGKLFMKIHPDLLWATPERRKVNEASMQGLNEILAWEKALRSGHMQQAPTTRRVEFFSRDHGEDGDPISATFELPEGFKAAPHSIPDASRAVNTFLSKLLIKGEVLGHKEQEVLEDADEHLKKWKEIASKRSDDQQEATFTIKDVARPLDRGEVWVDEREEAKRVQKFEAMGDFGAAFDGQDMEVPEGAHERTETTDPRFEKESLEVPPVQPLKRVIKKKEKAVLGHLADDFGSMMKEFWKKEDIPDVAELIAADLLHFDQSLSPVDCAKAVSTLAENLVELRYDLWYFVPIFITNKFGVETDMEGFLSVPYWFSVKEFLTFVSENEELIRNLQEVAFDGARSFDKNIAEARDVCGLADVVVRCGVEDAQKAAVRLAECADLLQEGGWGGLVVEIIDNGWQYGARESGVMQLPADFTKEGLKEFCEYLQETDQLKMVKDAYKQVISSLSEMDRLMNVCYEVIAPMHIDVENEECGTEHKLAFVKELYSISGELSKYDWSDYTFTLGPLDLNWDGGVLSLPHNFHGENFARTVHMLHEEDQKEFGEEEPSDMDQLSLDLEAKRIRAELVSTGLLELDPEKQTAEQKTLLHMIESYSGEDDVQRYIRDSFPNYVQKHEENSAHSMELISQMRNQQKTYSARKLRHYHKNKMRPRVGQTLDDWDFL